MEIQLTLSEGEVHHAVMKALNEKLDGLLDDKEILDMWYETENFAEGTTVVSTGVQFRVTLVEARQERDSEKSEVSE